MNFSLRLTLAAAATFAKHRAQAAVVTASR
jgi:hypothetical protein